MVYIEDQHVALVARNEVVSIARFSHGGQQIVRWIGAAIYRPRATENVVKFAKIVDEASYPCRDDVLAQAWAPRHSAELEQLVA